MTVRAARAAAPLSGIAADPTLPRLVFYAALSKASGDRDQESIASQLARQRAKADAEYPNGYVLLRDGHRDGHIDDGYSGSKRDRGPALERAIRAAVEAAADGTGTPVELWVNTPARLARGSGKKDKARSIMELFVQMQREGVTLRAVNDDDMVRREELVGFASRMAAKYSEDLRESVERANLRKLAAGQNLGGPLSDGYRPRYECNDAGRVIARHPEIDPERGPIWREIYDLAARDVGDGEIARRMNAKGYRKRTGAPWDARAVCNGLTNPWYCGKIAHRRFKPDEKIYQGNHPALVDVATFDAIQAARGLRQIAPEFDRTGGGRPPQNHALAQLAFCSCGQPMSARTSTHVRVDGTRRRSYRCRASLLRTGTCDVPSIDAEVVDAAILAELDGLLVDFDGWKARILSGHAVERDRLYKEVERAERDTAEQTETVARVEARWTAYVKVGDDAGADAVVPMVTAERARLDDEHKRLQATRDALALVPDEAPMDAMLDYGNALREAVKGRVGASDSMREVNAALRSIFSGFELTPSEYAGLEDGGRIVFGGRPAVKIQPYMSEAVAARLLAAGTMPSGRGAGPRFAPLDGEAGDAPPLRWLIAGDGPRNGAPVPESDDDGAILIETRTDGCVLA